MLHWDLCLTSGLWQVTRGETKFHCVALHRNDITVGGGTNEWWVTLNLFFPRLWQTKTTMKIFAKDQIFCWGKAALISWSQWINVDLCQESGPWITSIYKSFLGTKLSLTMGIAPIALSLGYGHFRSCLQLMTGLCALSKIIIVTFWGDM